MKRTAQHLLLWSVAAWCVAPFLWQIFTSLKTTSEIEAIPPTYLPLHPTLRHYVELFTRKPFALYLWNSFVISSVSTVLAVTIAAMAGYVFSRLRLAHAHWIRGALAAVLLFPPIIFFFPLYELVRWTGLAGNPIALVVPYVAFNLPMATLFLTAFFRTVPLDLEEAARVDGFSRWQILSQIIIPLSAPAMVTVSILTFIACWNEFLLALTFMPHDSSKTVTAGIAGLSGSTIYEVPWGAISAGVVISTAPLAVLVLLFQRRIMQGLTAGAVKG